MKKLLAVVCACLLLGGCGQPKEYEYTSAAAQSVRPISLSEDSIYLLAQYPSFVEMAYDNCMLAAYDLETGKERLINSLPEGDHICSEERVWFYDEEQGIMSCSLADGSERQEFPKGDEDRIILLADAGKKMILQRVYETEGQNGVPGFFYSYSIWDRETGEETMLAEKTPEVREFISWDGVQLIWASGIEESYKVTLWQDGGTWTLSDSVRAGLAQHLDGDLYWIEIGEDGAALCRQQLPDGETGRVSLPTDQFLRLEKAGGTLYLLCEDELYRFAPPGQPERIPADLPPEACSEIFLSDEYFCYAVAEDGRLTFVREKMEE